MTKHRGGGALIPQEEDKARRQFERNGANLAEASALWRNSIRYYPDAKLRSRLGRNRRIKEMATGDILKASVDRMLTVAGEFVALGEREWSSLP